MPRHIVAIGLLTEEDVDLLGRTFTRLWPIDSVPRFDELLAAIDEADQRLEEARGTSGKSLLSVPEMRVGKAGDTQ